MRSVLRSKSSKNLLVCFSGKIASGKTSLSKAVASQLECGWASFGSYLKAYAKEQGVDPSCRESLQELGQSRIDGDARSFCSDVLMSGGFVLGQDFVLDSVRHHEILPHLADLASPSEVRLVFIDTPNDVRRCRVRSRSQNEETDFERADRHPVESGMNHEIQQRADVIIDGVQSLVDAVNECMEMIQEWRRIT